MRNFLSLASVSKCLNSRRVTAHATIAASVSWGLYFLNIATPGFLDRAGNLKGTDFLQFYTAGEFFRTGRMSALYDVQQFWAACERAVPGITNRHYFPVYPPQVALLFSPLSSLPYLSSLLFWVIINVTLYAACGAALALMCPTAAARRFAFVMSALAFPPFLSAIAHAQVSIVALACITVAFGAYIRRMPLIAGMALGCTVFKPQIFVAFLVVLAIVRSYRVIAGMLMAAAVQMCLTAMLGAGALMAYFRLVAKLPHLNAAVLAVKPFQMHSLRAFWMLLPVGRAATVLWLVSVTAILIILGARWHRQGRARVQFALLILAATLSNPHLYIYDAVILAPALVVAAEESLTADARRAELIRVGLYALFACFFFGSLTRFTHLQLSVPVLVVLFYALSSKGSENLHRESNALPPHQAAAYGTSKTLGAVIQPRVSA